MVPWRRGLDHGQGGPWGAARRLVEAKDSHDLSGVEWTDSDGILMDFHVHVHVWTEIYLDFMPRLCLTGLPSTKHDVTWQDFGRTISSRVWWIQQSALFERITLWLFGGHCSLVEPSKVCVTCVLPWRQTTLLASSVCLDLDHRVQKKMKGNVWYLLSFFFVYLESGA